MNLSDLATHICEQTGMSDTDDVAAAKMFIQRRLEMIWNTQLWRDSLIEATMTLSTDGTVDLADTIWLPSRGTLLLPTEFDTILAVRQSTHALQVATLETYFRTDADWLNMTGDPTEFQVLRPAVWEFDAATTLYLKSADATAVSLQAGADGVVRSTQSVTPTNVLAGTSAGETLVIWNLTREVTASNAALTVGTLDWADQGASNSVIAFYSYGVTRGIVYMPTGVTPTVGQLIRITGTDNGGVTRQYTATVTDFGVLGPTAAATTAVNYDGDDTGSFMMQHGYEVYFPTIAEDFTLALGETIAQKRQRIRLSATPTQELPLRVLGKMKCPTLTTYDEPPINNVEPCLMAFARGDMLMRQRQHGKAQLAQQEGAALLKQLAESEAHQQANNHRIQPDSGFGEYPFSHYPSHSAPL